MGSTGLTGLDGAAATGWKVEAPAFIELGCAAGAFIWLLGTNEFESWLKDFAAAAGVGVKLVPGVKLAEGVKLGGVGVKLAD